MLVSINIDIDQGNLASIACRQKQVKWSFDKDSGDP